MSTSTHQFIQQHLRDNSTVALRDSLAIPHANVIAEDWPPNVIVGVLNHLAVQKSLDQETGVVVGEAKMVPSAGEVFHLTQSV